MAQARVPSAQSALHMELNEIMRFSVFAYVIELFFQFGITLAADMRCFRVRH